MRQTIKHEERGMRSRHKWPPRRYEVHYKVAGINQWQPQSTNATKLGALLDYYTVPLGAVERRIVDNGRDWRK